MPARAADRCRARSGAIAAMLRQRFERLQIVEGDACAIAEILAERGVTRLAAIVSSLPIKWFPIAGQRAGDRALSSRWPARASSSNSPTRWSRRGGQALDLDGSEVARVWSNSRRCRSGATSAGEGPHDDPSAIDQSFPLDLDFRCSLGDPRMQSRIPARFPAPYRIRIPLPRGRHRRRLEAQEVLVLGPEPQRRYPKDPPQGAEGDEGHLRPRQSRRDAARLHRPPIRRRDDRIRRSSI